MALYLPRHFAPEDIFAAAQEIIDYDPFATVVTVGQDGTPWVTHAPIAWNAGKRCLTGHFARANAHSQLILEGRSTLAIFHGPHAFVSPTWYVSPGQVPTWNYAVLHISGRPRVMTEAETVDELVRLATAFDADAVMDMDHVRRQAPGVVAFQLDVESVEVKLKMSQNKAREDRHAVIRQLSTQPTHDAQAVASWMRTLEESVKDNA